MSTQHSAIYVNLPVQDLPKSRAFFTALGYSFNEQWSSEKGACLVLGPNLHAMLLTHEFFLGFHGKPIVDAHTSSEVLVCLACDSRDQVMSLAAAAEQAGGKVPKPPVDHGFMLQHAFHDLDGHIWELVCMAPPA